MTETEAKLMAARAEREALRIQLDAEREAHKATHAQLTALAAEHEAGARAAEERVGRLVRVLLEIRALMDFGHVVTENSINAERRVLEWTDSARAAIAEVHP